MVNGQIAIVERLRVTRFERSSFVSPSLWRRLNARKFNFLIFFYSNHLLSTRLVNRVTPAYNVRRLPFYFSRYGGSCSCFVGYVKFTVGYIVIATFQLSVYVLYLTTGNAKNEVVAKWLTSSSSFFMLKTRKYFLNIVCIQKYQQGCYKVKLIFNRFFLKDPSFFMQ